jgi:hypothetical protein
MALATLETADGIIYITDLKTLKIAKNFLDRLEGSVGLSSDELSPDLTILSKTGQGYAIFMTFISNLVNQPL